MKAVLYLRSWAGLAGSAFKINSNEISTPEQVTVRAVPKRGRFPVVGMQSVFLWGPLRAVSGCQANILPA